MHLRRICGGGGGTNTPYYIKKPACRRLGPESINSFASSRNEHIIIIIGWNMITQQRYGKLGNIQKKTCNTDLGHMSSVRFHIKRGRLFKVGS